MTRAEIVGQLATVAAPLLAASMYEDEWSEHSTIKELAEEAVARARVLLRAAEESVNAEKARGMKMTPHEGRTGLPERSRLDMPMPAPPSEEE